MAAAGVLLAGTTWIHFACRTTQPGLLLAGVSWVEVDDAIGKRLPSAWPRERSQPAELASASKWQVPVNKRDELGKEVAEK